MPTASARSPRDAEEGFWNPSAYLWCAGCGKEFPLGAYWRGCPSCGAPLLVAYRPVSIAEGELAHMARDLANALLPIARDRVVSIGNAHTPMVQLRSRTGAMWLKMEGHNPSGSHKDRFHAVAAAVARQLGYGGVVASSTGNHGAAAAAFAAAVGLRSVVLLAPEAPSALATQIGVYGAHVAILSGEVPEALAALIARGWCPCTSADHLLLGYGNPYGQEGYKDIAYEIVLALGRVPAAVAVPVASGDTVYGVWRGFRDLHERLGMDMPLIVGCQPEGAAPLALLTSGSPEQARPRVPRPSSIALSTRDAQSGWHASYALQRGGLVYTVREGDIASGLRALGRQGLSAEPASTLGVAAIERLREAGELDPSADAVALVTSSGLNWTEHITKAFELPAPADDLDALLAVVESPERS